MLFTTANGAVAHNPSQSFSDWTIDNDNVQLTFSVKTREVTRLQPVAPGSLDTRLMRHLDKSIGVSSGNVICQRVAQSTPLASAQGYMRLELNFQCSTPGHLTVKIDSFFNLAESHIHYANIRKGNQLSQQYLFTHENRSHTILSDVEQKVGDILRNYIMLGTEHIVGGIDHIAFLLALVLVCRRKRELLWAITGFTLGHSLTLAFASLNWVRPDMSLVEAAIGFTIALVAVEKIAGTTDQGRRLAMVTAAALIIMLMVNQQWNIGLSSISLMGFILLGISYLWPTKSESQSQPFRLFITTVFGLIHGFGFAGALSDIGLAGNQLLWSLLGFNLGIELGQLAIILLLWVVSTWLSRWLASDHRRSVSDWSSAALCGLGLYWFIGRSYGII
jgi:hypothetical protein